MFTCSRCSKVSRDPRFECAKCRSDYCNDCANESVRKCLRCGGDIGLFRPPVMGPTFEFVPTSE